MRNLIGIPAIICLVFLQGCATRAYCGPSVSVSIEAGYSTFYDEDIDWDNVIVIDGTRMGLWVMLPSGRWIFRCRGMWWNSDIDEWCFGPWYYDYAVVYGHQYPFHFVGFHVYMHRHYRPWHTRYFAYNDNRYVSRVEYRSWRHEAPVIERREAVKQREVRPEQNREKITVITRQPDRIGRGSRNDAIDNKGGKGGEVEITRTRTVTRESGNRSGTPITRTDSRRDGRRR